MCTGWVVVMGGGDLLQLQLAPRHTKLGIKAIHQLFPRHPDLLGEREGPGSTHGNSTHKLILSPVLSQRRSQLEPSSSSSPPHRFTTTSPCWSSGCSRSRSCRPAVPEQSEWVSACRWRWQCARHLTSSPPSRHCSRLLVVHH